MRKAIWVVQACLVVAVGALAVGHPESSAVKLCRADAQNLPRRMPVTRLNTILFTEQQSSPNAPIRELPDRDDEFMS